MGECYKEEDEEEEEEHSDEEEGSYPGPTALLPAGSPPGKTSERLLHPSGLATTPHTDTQQIHLHRD